MSASLLGKAASVWAKVAGWLGVRPTYITIHHSESGPDITAADIDRWHREERKWIGIAYHWVIERLPKVRAVTGRPDRDDQGRPNPVMGAAAWGLNGKSLAICVVGNFETEPVTDEVFRELVYVVAVAMFRHGVPAARVIGHRDVAGIIKDPAAATACPGRHLYALLPKVRAEAAAKVAAYRKVGYAFR
jgi:hypothetical protein